MIAGMGNVEELELGSEDDEEDDGANRGGFLAALMNQLGFR